jgi:hypothetical protein
MRPGRTPVIFCEEMEQMRTISRGNVGAARQEKSFYSCPEHETFPVYFNPDVFENHRQCRVIVRREKFLCAVDFSAMPAAVKTTAMKAATVIISAAIAAAETK